MVGPNDHMTPGMFHSLRAMGIPEDPWNEVVFGLWVGGSEMGYPRNEFSAVVSVYDWHGRYRGPEQRLEWLPPEGTPHLILPMYDAAQVPPQEDLEMAVDFIYRYHREGKHVLVRCQAGLNRSSLVTAQYMCERLGFTGYEAVELIREVRDGALFNDTFVNYLRRKYK